MCFLAFICSINTFQSKNSPHSLSSLYFQPDEKRGKRIQKLQEETVKPRSEIQNMRGEWMWRCSLVPQSTSNSVSENSVHGMNSGTLGELEVSTRAPRTRYASKSRRCHWQQVVKWQILKFSRFCHVRRDSRAPITRRM